MSVKLPRWLTVDVDDGHPLSRDTEFIDWVREQGVDPHRTRKVKIRGWWMDVWGLANDAEGRKYVIPGTSDVASTYAFVWLKSAPRAKVWPGMRAHLRIVRGEG